MGKRPREEHLQYLYQLLAEIQDPADIAALLDDVCTRKEVENMAERVCAARLLMAGKTYNQVMDEAAISSATLSRVSRCVQYGAGYSRLVAPAAPDAPESPETK